MVFLFSLHSRSICFIISFNAIACSSLPGSGNFSITSRACADAAWRMCCQFLSTVISVSEFVDFLFLPVGGSFTGGGGGTTASSRVDIGAVDGGDFTGGCDAIVDGIVATDDCVAIWYISVPGDTKFVLTNSDVPSLSDDSLGSVGIPNELFVAIGGGFKGSKTA